MSSPGPRKTPTLKRKPKAVTRRTEEQRRADEAAEQTRLKAKEQAAIDEEKSEANQRRVQYGWFDQGRGRGRGRGGEGRGRGGRGGFMGDRGVLQGQLSGLGTGSEQPEGHGRRMWGERAHGQASSGQRGPRARDDEGSTSGGARERDAGGASASGASASSSGKARAPAKPSAARDNGDIEMTDAAPTLVKRDKPVKKAESEEEGSDVDSGVEVIDLEQLSLMQNGDGGLLPVAAGRQDHVERQFYINTDSSAAVAASKARSRRPDPELEDVVKVEDEDDAMPDAVKEEPPGSPELSKRLRRAPKARPKPATTPQAVTEEQKIQETNRLVLLDELGPLATPEPPAEGADAPPEQPFNPRQDTLFLFQLPPRLPPLTQRGVKVKEEPKDDPDLDAPPKPDADDKTEIKEEESTTHAGLTDTAPSDPETHLQPGYVGDMKVWKSGKVTLDWGGVRMIVRKGYDSNFAETVVGMSMKPRSESEGGVTGEYEGAAHSFGQVRGKMVVTPDYGEILGLEKGKRPKVKKDKGVRMDGVEVGVGLGGAAM